MFRLGNGSAIAKKVLLRHHDGGDCGMVFFLYREPDNNWKRLSSGHHFQHHQFYHNGPDDPASTVEIQTKDLPHLPVVHTYPLCPFGHSAFSGNYIRPIQFMFNNSRHFFHPNYDSAEPADKAALVHSKEAGISLWKISDSFTSF